LIAHPKSKINNLPKQIRSYKEKIVKYDHNYMHTYRLTSILFSKFLPGKKQYNLFSTPVTSL